MNRIVRIDKPEPKEMNHSEHNEQQFEKMRLLTCTDDQDSDQPVHSCSLISLRCQHVETLQH